MDGLISGALEALDAGGDLFAVGNTVRDVIGRVERFPVSIASEDEGKAGDLLDFEAARLLSETKLVPISFPVEEEDDDAVVLAVAHVPGARTVDSRGFATKLFTNALLRQRHGLAECKLVGVGGPFWEIGGEGDGELGKVRFFGITSVLGNGFDGIFGVGYINGGVGRLGTDGGLRWREMDGREEVEGIGDVCLSEFEGERFWSRGTTVGRWIDEGRVLEEAFLGEDDVNKHGIVGMSGSKAVARNGQIFQWQKTIGDSWALKIVEGCMFRGGGEVVDFLEDSEKTLFLVERGGFWKIGVEGKEDVRILSGCFGGICGNFGGGVMTLSEYGEGRIIFGRVEDDEWKQIGSIATPVAGVSKMGYMEKEGIFLVCSRPVEENLTIDYKDNRVRSYATSETIAGALLIYQLRI